MLSIYVMGNGIDFNQVLQLLCHLKGFHQLFYYNVEYIVIIDKEALIWKLLHCEY